MTKTELQTKITLYRRELRDLEAIKISCTTCEHGDNAGYCGKFQATPPAEVQVAGCDDWVHDGIPF